MTQQLELPAQLHSATSVAAAVQAAPKSIPDRARVLGFLRLRGGLGATDEEMQDALALKESTQRPRRVSLVPDLVRDSGTTRETKSGRQATVWVAI